MKKYIILMLSVFICSENYDDCLLKIQQLDKEIQRINVIIDDLNTKRNHVKHDYSTFYEREKFERGFSEEICKWQTKLEDKIQEKNMYYRIIMEMKSAEYKKLNQKNNN